MLFPRYVLFSVLFVETFTTAVGRLHSWGNWNKMLPRGITLQEYLNNITDLVSSELVKKGVVIPLRQHHESVNGRMLGLQIDGNYSLTNGLVTSFGRLVKSNVAPYNTLAPDNSNTSIYSGLHVVKVTMVYELTAMLTLGHVMGSVEVTCTNINFNYKIVRVFNQTKTFVTPESIKIGQREHKFKPRSRPIYGIYRLAKPNWYDLDLAAWHQTVLSPLILKTALEIQDFPIKVKGHW